MLIYHSDGSPVKLEIKRPGLSSELEDFLEKSDKKFYNVKHLVSHDNYYAVRIPTNPNLNQFTISKLNSAFNPDIHMQVNEDYVEIDTKYGFSEENVEYVQRAANDFYDILKKENCLKS